MQGYRWPQKDAIEATRETDVGKIQRDCPTVDEHPDQGRPGPTGNPQANQGDAGDAPNRDGNASKFLTEQQPRDERWDDQQREAGGGVGDRREGQYLFHRPATS